MLCTSNRTLLVMLNTSQRNCRLWCSLQGICQRLESPISIPKKPSPYRLLRVPACPGRGSTNEFCALQPSPNALTWPSWPVPAAQGFSLAPTVCTGCVRYALPERSQSVGHCAPLNTLNGNPLVSRNNPDNCQPPMSASAKRFTSCPKVLPRPNGNSTIQSAVN